MHEVTTDKHTHRYIRKLPQGHIGRHTNMHEEQWADVHTVRCLNMLKNITGSIHTDMHANIHEETMDRYTHR